MKKIFYLLLVSFAGTSAMAQDLDKINTMMETLRYKEAKAAIDKYLQDPKKAGESAAWYYKGRIYNALAHDSTMPQSELYNLRTEAFNAFKKNQEMDPKDMYMKLESFNSYLDLYFGYYDLGAREFNSKNFEGAMRSFKKAMEVKDYILSKNYQYTQATLYPLDTALVLNTAASAIQAKKDDEAIGYYKKLIDANVSGDGYRDVYEYVVDYYVRKNDEASLKPVLDKAKSIYPGHAFWPDAEIRMVSKHGDKNALLAKYEELSSKDPNNFTPTYNYGIELYNSVYGRDTGEPADEGQKEKLTQVLKRAIALEKDDDVASTVLMANHLFNMAADQLNASNAIKSTKPEDVKKKNDLKAAAHKTMDECIQYSETAIKFFEGLPSRTNMQKANYKIMLGYLYDIYTIKNNKVKAAEYQKKNAAADKL